MLEQRLTNLVVGIREKFNAFTQSKGAANGLAPLDAQVKVAGIYLYNAYNKLVQNLTALPIDWRNGLYVKFTMPAANVTATVSSFNFPITGEAHIIVLLNNSGATRTFNLPNVATHKASTYAISLNNNQRRKLIAHFDGATYDWTIEAAKTL